MGNHNSQCKRPTVTTLKLLEPHCDRVMGSSLPSSTVVSSRRSRNSEVEDGENVVQTSNQYAALFQKCNDCLEKDTSYKNLMNYFQQISETSEVIRNIYRSLASFDTRLPKNRPGAAHPRRRSHPFLDEKIKK